jgi:hypothetical protein
MAATDLLRGTRVTFSSQVTGAVSYDPFTGTRSGGGAGSDWLMKLLKPAVYVQTSPGAPPMAYEPYGRPTKDYSLVILALGVAAAAGVAWGLMEIGRRRGR